MGQPCLVILLADIKVIGAKAGSSVYAAGAGVQRNMVAAKHHGLLIHQGMLSGHQLQLGAGQLGNDLIVLDAGLLGNCLSQILGNNINLTVFRLHQRIGKLRIYGDRTVAG